MADINSICEQLLREISLCSEESRDYLYNDIGPLMYVFSACQENAIIAGRSEGL